MYTIHQNNLPSLPCSTLGEVLVEINRKNTLYKGHAGKITVFKGEQHIADACRGYNHWGVEFTDKTTSPVDRLLALLEEEKPFMRRPGAQVGLDKSPWLAPYEVTARRWNALNAIGSMAYGVIPGVQKTPNQGMIDYMGKQHYDLGSVVEAMFFDTFGWGHNGPRYDGQQTNARHEVHVAYALLRGDHVPENVLAHYRQLDQRSYCDLSWMFLLLNKPFMQGRFTKSERILQLMNVITQPGSKITEITQDNIGYLTELMAELQESDGWIDFDNLLFEKGLWPARELQVVVDLEKLGKPINDFAQALRDALGKSMSLDNMAYLKERVANGQLSKREVVEHTARIHAQEAMNPYTFANRVATAIEMRDMGYLMDFLGHPGNETTKKLIESHYGVTKLQRGNAEQRMQAIFAAVGYRNETDYTAAKARYTQAQEARNTALVSQQAKEAESKREQNAKHLASMKNFNLDGTIMDGSKLIEHLIAIGFNVLAAKKVGAVSQFSIRNPETGHTIRVRKSDGTLDYAVILLEKLEAAQTDSDATTPNGQTV